MSFFKWYSVCATVISCLNIIRYIPSFWVGLEYVPHIVVWRIINLSWLIQCFIYRVVMLRACWCRSHLRSFYRYFNQIIADNTICRNSMDFRSQELSKLVRFSTVVAWLCAFLCFAGIIIQVVTDDDKDFILGITNPFSHHNIAANIIFVSLYIWESGAWLFPVLFHVTLFVFLRNHFSALSNDLARMIKDEGQSISQKIKDIRRKHLQLCKVIAILEQDIKFSLSGNYVSNIFLVCFIVYQLVTSDPSAAMTYVAFSSWLVMNVMVMVTVSIAAAQVNEQAHSPLEHIFDVDMNAASAFESLELQMFLSKLNGPTIGFTAMGFVTVTKEFILTLGGIILTYFFLLIQFKL